MNPLREQVNHSGEGPKAPDRQAEFRLLDAVAADPESTQADLAARVGVAVGTVNWYLKRFAADGYIHMTRIGRWRWRYILTPRGLAEKARLGAAFVERSMRLYRETRQRSRERLVEVRQAGFEAVCIEGNTDLADICRLTCLEQGVAVSQDGGAPVLQVEVTGVRVQWPQPAGPKAGK
jgi:DNA-binding MarR family transcriptional regulator